MNFFLWMELQLNVSNPAVVSSQNRHFSIYLFFCIFYWLACMVNSNKTSKPSQKTGTFFPRLFFLTQKVKLKAGILNVTVCKLLKTQINNSWYFLVSWPETPQTTTHWLRDSCAKTKHKFVSSLQSRKTYLSSHVLQALWKQHTGKLPNVQTTLCVLLALLHDRPLSRVLNHLCKTDAVKLCRIGKRYISSETLHLVREEYANPCFKLQRVFQANFPDTRRQLLRK